MNSQNDKESLGRDRAAIIAGIFVVIGACVTGVFLLLNTLVEKGTIVIAPSAMSTTSIQPSQISPPTNNPVPTIIASTATNLPMPILAPTSTVVVSLQFPIEISVTAVGWTNTNIVLNQGDKVTIEYVSGQWKAASGWDLVGPKGDWRYVMPDYRLPNYPLLTLIARVGNTTPFFVGEGLNFTATISGELELGANDIENMYGDNDGSLIVKINVQK